MDSSSDERSDNEQIQGRGTREEPIELDENDTEDSDDEIIIPTPFSNMLLNRETFFSDNDDEDDEQFDSSDEDDYIGLNIPYHYSLSGSPQHSNIRSSALDSTNLSEKEKIIQLYSTEDNFTYGLIVAGACTNVILEKNHLKGKCNDHIHVNIYFDDIEKFKIRNITCSSCNETQLWCKHSCALLLFFTRFPEKVCNLQKIKETIEKISTPEIAMAYINLSKKNTEFLNFIQVEITKLSKNESLTNETLLNISNEEEKILDMDSSLPLHITRNTENYLDPCFFSNKIEREILKIAQRGGFDRHCMVCNSTVYSSTCSLCGTIQCGNLLQEVNSSIVTAKKFILNKNQLSGIEVLLESLRGLLSFQNENIFTILKDALELLTDEIQNVFIEFTPGKDFIKEFTETVNELIQECLDEKVKEIIAVLKNVSNCSNWDSEDLKKILRGEFVECYAESKKVIESRCNRLISEKRFEECLNYSKYFQSNFYIYVSLFKMKKFEESFEVGKKSINNTIELDKSINLASIEELTLDELKLTLKFYTEVIVSKQWATEKDIAIILYRLYPHFIKLSEFGLLEIIIFEKCKHFAPNWSMMIEKVEESKEQRHLLKELKLYSIQHQEQCFEKATLTGDFPKNKPTINEEFIIQTYELCEDKKQFMKILSVYEHNKKMIESLVVKIPEVEAMYFSFLLQSNLYSEAISKVPFTRFIDEKIDAFIKYVRCDSRVDNLFSNQKYSEILLFEQTFKSLKEKGVKGMNHLLKEYSKTLLPYYHIPTNSLHYCYCTLCVQLEDFIKKTDLTRISVIGYHQRIDDQFPDLIFEKVKGRKRKKTENESFIVTKKISPNYLGDVTKYFQKLKELSKWICEYDDKLLKDMIHPVISVEHIKFLIEKKNTADAIVLIGETLQRLSKYILSLRSIDYLSPVLKEVENIQTEINEIMKTLLNEILSIEETRKKFIIEIEKHFNNPNLEKSVLDFFKVFIQNIPELKEMYFSYQMKHFGTQEIKELFFTNNPQFYQKIILELKPTDIESRIGLENTKLLFKGISQLQGDLSSSVYHLLTSYSKGYLPVKGKLYSITCNCSVCRSIDSFYSDFNKTEYEFKDDYQHHYKYLDKIPNLTVTIDRNPDYHNHAYTFRLKKNYHTLHENFLDSKDTINEMVNYFLKHSKTPELLENVMHPLIQVKYIKNMIDSNDKKSIVQLMKFRYSFSQLREKIEDLKNLLKNEIQLIRSSITDLVKKSCENIVEKYGEKEFSQILREMEDYQICLFFGVLSTKCQKIVSSLLLESFHKINYREFEDPCAILQHCDFSLLQNTLSQWSTTQFISYENTDILFKALKTDKSNEKLIRHLLGLYTQRIIPPLRIIIDEKDIPESFSEFKSFLTSPYEFDLKLDRVVTIPDQLSKKLFIEQNKLKKMGQSHDEVKGEVIFFMRVIELMVKWIIENSGISPKDLFNEYKHILVKLHILNGFTDKNELNKNLEEMKKEVSNIENQDRQVFRIIKKEAENIINRIEEKERNSDPYQKEISKFISSPSLTSYNELGSNEKWSRDKFTILKQIEITALNTQNINHLNILIEIYTLEKHQHGIITTFVKDPKNDPFTFTLLIHQISMFSKYKIPEKNVRDSLQTNIISFIPRNLFSNYNQDIIRTLFQNYRNYSLEIVQNITNFVKQISTPLNQESIKNWLKFSQNLIHPK